MSVRVEDMATAKPVTKMTMIQSLNLALTEAMEEDADVVMIGEDIADPEGGGVFHVSKGLSTRFGENRVRSTPIAEQAIAGAAIGAALGGLRPVAEIMLMNFTTVAMDMIINHAAKLRYMSGGQTHLPLTFITMTGAGMNLGGQHSDFLEVWFAHTAGIKVVVPSNPADAYGLLKSCIADPDPCLLIEPISLLHAAGAAPEPGYSVPLGQAKIVRPGTDFTIVTYGRQVNDAVAAARALEADGVDVEVIDLRTIAPMDMATVTASAENTGRVVIVHEAVVTHGVGAEIAAQLNERLFGKLKAPVQRIGSKYTPVPYASHLEAAFMPSADKIKQLILHTLNK